MLTTSKPTFGRLCHISEYPQAVVHTDYVVSPSGVVGLAI